MMDEPWRQLLSATVEYQTDALFPRSLRPAEKGRSELAPQRGGERAAPRESPHSSIIANGRSDSSGSPNRQRRKFHRRRRAAATTATAATALPGVIATDGVIAIDGVIAALASYAPPTALPSTPELAGSAQYGKAACIVLLVTKTRAKYSLLLRLRQLEPSLKPYYPTSN